MSAESLSAQPESFRTIAVTMTGPDATAVSALAAAFISSVSSPPPSPYYAVTGRQCDLTNLRTLFCECHVRAFATPMTT